MTEWEDKTESWQREFDTVMDMLQAAQKLNAELLEACEAALQCIAANTPIVDSSEPVYGKIADAMDAVRSQLRAAIRKAKGEA
jgi:hypothetical protein